MSLAVPVPGWPTWPARARTKFGDSGGGATRQWRVATSRRCRAKLVATIFAARQFVNHGHVLVNGRRVNIASYRVKEGDVIEVRQKSKQMALILEAIQLTERDVPDYLEVDHSRLIVRFVRTPALGHVPYPVQMEPNLVVEYYAKN